MDKVHREVTKLVSEIQCDYLEELVTAVFIAHTKVLTAIRIGNPASWQGAVNAANESGGQINYVTDEEILCAYQTIASTEGIFAEPASAASIAGVFKLHREGYFKPGDSVVCVLTGHGLKDPNIAIKTVDAEPLVVQDTEAAVMAAIEQLTNKK
jgi:threonine synthase